MNKAFYKMVNELYKTLKKVKPLSKIKPSYRGKLKK